MFLFCRPGRAPCRVASCTRVRALPIAQQVAALALSSLAPLASAETVPLSTVVVTATRTPERVSDAVAEVTVIDRDALDAATGRTLVEVLSQQPGLQFASNGGLGKASSLFIRGLESRHTLLLVDGVRVGSATLGTPSLDNLPIESIERIEIVRGPLSALYGSDAVGGVIQVFTRRGRQGLRPNAKLIAGSRQYAQAAGGVALGASGFDAAVQVQHTETRGFSATNANAQFGNYNPDDDGFRQNAGSMRLGWQATADWRVDALALQADGVTHFDDGPGADSRAGVHNRVLSLQTDGRVSDGWRSKLAVARSDDVFDTEVSASAFAVLGPVETVQRQFSWENTVATPAGTVLALLERIEQHVQRPGAPFAVSDRGINAAALALSGNASGHTWQASLRHDRNSQFDGQTTGALAYGYDITPTWRAAASYGTSFVAPSFNQLYFPGFGNPSLQPEQGKHGELNVRWTADEHTVRAAWFAHRIRGYISSGPAPTNIPRTRIDGATLAYEGHWNDVALGASLDHVDPRNATTGSANFDKQLPRRAKNAVKAHADWTRGEFAVGTTLVAFSERFDNAANTLRLPGYGTLDLRADWSFAPDWTLGARLNNVAGKVYETAYGYNQPGRELYVLLRHAPR